MSPILKEVEVDLNFGVSTIEGRLPWEARLYFSMPGKYEDLALTLLAQIAANIKGGITILSLYAASELNNEVVKIMIGEVKEILK